MGLNILMGQTAVVALANHFLLLDQNLLTKGLNPIIRSSFHFVIALLLFYQGLPKFRDTYFYDLGLPISASHEEVLNTYDKVQEFLKTGAPEHAERVKRAYEVLSNQDTRILYSMYGDVAISAKTPLDFTLILLTVSLSYYVISCVLCCVLTRSSKLRFSKYTCILYNAVAFFLEIDLRFFYATFMRSVFYLNRLLPYQHIEFLRAMPPTVLMLSALVTHFFVVDLDKLNMFLLQSTVATNTVILEKMSNVVSATDHLKKVGREHFGIPTDTPRDEKETTVGEFLETLDENQKKRLFNLLNTEEKKEKSKLLEFLKSFGIYFSLFLLMRFFSK